MKHSKSNRAIVAIAMMLIGWLPSLAYDFEANGIYFNIINDKEVEVTYKDLLFNYSENLIKIPSSVCYNGVTYCVTGIGERAFNSCRSTTSIDIPNSVIIIGKNAFELCENLKTIKIPDSVISIEFGAFNWCTGLTSAIVGNSVKSIGEWAFRLCENLRSIEISSSVTSIGSGAFYNCSSLEHIVIDPHNTIYDSRENCNAIIESSSNTLILGCQNTKIPNSVTSIGVNAFSNCKGLISIEIPNSVTSIGDSAFNGCTNLISIEIPNSIKSIRSYTFGECTKLTNVVIPNSVTNIEGSAFYNCTSLESIVIPNSVTSIEYGAFAQCKSLTSVTWNAVKCSDFYNYDDAPFYGCTNITSFTFGENVEHIPAYICNRMSGLTNIVIPNSVTSIGSYTFYNCNNLNNVVWNAIKCNDFSSSDFLPFCGCANIISFTFGASVEHIPAYLCYGMSKLTNIEIPNSVTSIGSYAFNSCTSLLSIVIPNSVTSIGNRSFSLCKNLTSIVVESGNSIYDSRENCDAIIETPTNTLVVGCQSSKIPNSVTSIGSNAFYFCEGLSNIEIPSNVTNIGNDAFRGCSMLTSVEIPNSVISIGNNAFWGCSGLTDIVIGSGVKSIEWYAFYNCANLTKITCLPMTPPTITSNNTFSNYSAELYVQAGCKSTYQSANFWRDFNIKEIFIPSTSIALNKTSVTLKATKTFSLIATVFPETATNKSVTWTSSNDAVATVDEYGVITANALGEAIITATTIDGSNLSATCKVTVMPTLAESITLDQTEISLEATETATLVATILPELTTDKSVIWKSSNEAVATVDEYGVVTAIALGEAIITATTTDGTNLSATCKVTVVPTLVESITLDKTEINLEATQTAELTATVLPELATNKVVTWKSSDESAAIVDANGVVTAIALGESVITATTTDGTNLSATCKVTVVPTLAETITLDKTEISLEATETATLIITVLPELTTDKSVEWSSSNEAVAVVDENGVVTAVAVGEATITATTVDDSNLSASCKVSVVPTLAVSIELDQTEASVEEKSDLQLIATILPEHTTNKEVAWSSSDKWVASVDNYGLGNDPL